MEELKRSISVVEQRIFLKFCFLLKYSNGVSHSLLHKAVGKNALNLRSVENWMKSYKEGRTSAEDACRSGRPESSSTEEIRQAIQEALSETRRWSIDKLSARVGAPPSTVRLILTKDLGLIKKISRWVPHVMSEELRDFRYQTAQNNLAWYKHRPGMVSKIVCIDESYVEFYTPLQKHQAGSWVKPGTSADPLPRPELHERKILLTVGMDIRGIAFWETFEENIYMTGPLYKSFLERHLVQWCQEHKVVRPLVLHDSARAHKSAVVEELFTSRQWVHLPHPTYSPDMNPCDYNCFGHLKRELPHNRFDNKRDLDLAIKEVLERLNANGTFSGVQKLPEIWQRVIDSGGDYI